MPRGPPRVGSSPTPGTLLPPPSGRSPRAGGDSSPGVGRSAPALGGGDARGRGPPRSRPGRGSTFLAARASALPSSETSGAARDRTHLSLRLVNEPPSPDRAELELRLHEASRLSDEERWDEAFAILREEEELHPRDPILLCMLGVVSGEVEASGLAYDYFRRALAEQPADPFVLVPLGVGLARYDDPDAEGVLRLAALSAPDVALARLHYGAYLSREGQLELAREELSAARRLDPGDPRIARELGVVNLLAGHGEPALEELQAAVDLAEDDGDTRLFFGLALVQASRLEVAAEELYRAALDLSSDGEVQLVSALSCASQEWWDHAWEALARADLAEAPADPLLKAEVEEVLEAGSGEAEALLREELAPSMLRARLMEHL